MKTQYPPVHPHEFSGFEETRPSRCPQVLQLLSPHEQADSGVLQRQADEPEATEKALAATCGTAVEEVAHVTPVLVK